MEELLSFFRNRYHVGKVGDLTWMHAVNSKKRLRMLLDDESTMFCESDISVSPSGEVIAAHPPKVSSNLTLEELLTSIASSEKGIKLDFKAPEAVGPALDLLNLLEVKQPVILNADVFSGNGSYRPLLEPRKFISNCRNSYQRGVLSLGLTTQDGETRNSYTAGKMHEIMNACKELDQAIIPVRTSLLIGGWQQIKGLLGDTRYFISLWNKEPIDGPLQKWIREHIDQERAFCDFVDGEGNPFRF